MIKEYFATFEARPDEYVHHPFVRREVLRSLTTGGGVLNTTMNIKEWHNDLLDALVSPVAAISRGKKPPKNHIQRTSNLMNCHYDADDVADECPLKVLIGR